MNSFPRSSSCLFPARSASHLKRRNTDCGEGDNLKRSRTVHDFSILINFVLLEDTTTVSSWNLEEQITDDFFKPLRIADSIQSFKISHNRDQLKNSEKNIEKMFPSPNLSDGITINDPICEFQDDEPLSA